MQNEYLSKLNLVEKKMPSSNMLKGLMDKMVLLGLYWIPRILSPAVGLYFCSAGYDMFYFSFYKAEFLLYIVLYLLYWVY